MLKHPLHEEIGRILLSKMDKYNQNNPNTKMRVLLDPDCHPEQNKNRHRLPLFINEEKLNKTELCNVDAIIKVGKKIKILIEIEESENNPTHIFGKFFTSNLAKMYIYDTDIIDLPNSSVFFIQVIDTKNLPPKTSKNDKFCIIQDAINNLISTANKTKFEHGCIKEYKIILINNNCTEVTNFTEFKNWIDECLAITDVD